MASSIVFDFDGTLVDSSSGILSALSLSLSTYGYESIHVDSTHVGPPLPSVFRTLLPSEGDFHIDQLCNSFRHHYDNAEYLRCKPYEGVTEALDRLVCHGFRLFIVTNKRSFPTKKIIDFLEWNSYFDFIYSLDMCDSPDATKATALTNLLSIFDLEPSQTPYLGDRFADYKAASSVSMPFLFAEWGYASHSEFHGVSDFTCLPSPLSLMSPSLLQSFFSKESL